MEKLPISQSIEYGAKTVWKHIGLILLSALDYCRTAFYRHFRGFYIGSARWWTS